MGSLTDHKNAALSGTGSIADRETAFWASLASGESAPIRSLTFAVETPLTAPTPAVGSAGALTGDYSYKVIFETAVGQSSVGPESIIVSPVAKRINLTAIPTGSASVTKRILVRTKSGRVPPTMSGFGPEYYLLATINDNTTTVFEDNVADGALGAVDLANRSNETGAMILMSGVVDPTQPHITLFNGGHLGWSTTSWGRSALQKMLTHEVTGMDLTAIGVGSLNQAKGANFTTAVGTSCFQENVDGSQNSGMGSGAAIGIKFGGYNAVNGSAALAGGGSLVASANKCVADGYAALYYADGAAECVGVGFFAGVTDVNANAVTNAFGCSFIGSESGFDSPTQRARATAIGYRAKVGADDALVLGSSACRTGIGGTPGASALGGEVELPIAGRGIILTSPNGAVRRRLTVDNAGVLVNAAA